MDKFQRGKIYAIRAPNCDLVYIGSTISTLRQRISKHRADFKRHNEGKQQYAYSFKLIEIEGHYIELIENYPCADRNELNRREGEIMRETEGCVNQNIAGRTRAEYYNDNRKTKLAQMKQYRQDNRETILTKKKLKFNCECGGKYTRSSKSNHFKTKKHLKYLDNE